MLGSFGQPQNYTATIFRVVTAYTKICLDQPIDQLHCAMVTNAKSLREFANRESRSAGKPLIANRA